MGWFQRLLGGTAPSSMTPVGPVVTDLIPGKLVATIYTHNFAVGPKAIPCWTYVTRGFSPTGQKEFVFTLARGSRDDPTKPPSDPLRFFTQVFSLAEQKQFVEAGGFTCFRPPAAGFLGLKGMVGFAYTRPELLPGVELPPAEGCLTAVLLLPGEAEPVQAGWGYRVLARLGRAAQYYPQPPWSDPRRAAVLTQDEFRISLLGKMPTALLDGAFVRMFLRPTAVPAAGESGHGGPLGERLTLRIKRNRLPRVRELLAEVAAERDGAFALTFAADPDANARLAWQPGDTALHTITPSAGDASCLTGGFLAVVFGPSIADSGRVVEDGFALTFGADSWSQLRDALMNGEPIVLPVKGPGQIGLSVEWMDNPSEGTGAVKQPAPAFRIDSMMFYQPDEVLKARAPAVESIAEFVARVESTAADFWGGHPVGMPQPVLVVAAIKPGGRMRIWVEMPAAPGAEKAALDFAARLEKLSAPVVQSGPVAIAIRASLWGGGSEWPFIPKEWQDAVADGNVLIPDGILERVWPE